MTQIVQMIDVNEIVQRIDVNDVMDRVDVNKVIERVDVNELVQRVDVDAIAARLDIDAIADRIDIGRLLDRTEFADIIAKSTSGILTEFLDVLRRQAVAVDDLFDRVTNRPKRFATAAVGPADATPLASSDVQNRENHYCGSFSRLAAITIDAFSAWGLFLLAVGAFQATVSLFVAHPPRVFHHSIITVLLIIPFYFLYFSWQWGLGGRTFGMALVGVRVVTADGTKITTRQAAIRTVVLPFSIALLGLGLLGIATRPDRRALHDLAAGTSVTYDWDARASRLHWLEH